MALKISTSRHRAAGNGLQQVQLISKTPKIQKLETTEPVINKKHSGLGIASFTLSVIASILIFMFIVAAGVLTVTGDMTTPGPDGNPKSSVVAMVLGLAFFVFVALDLVAIILGIVGLTQKNRLKVFSILGILFAASIIIITVLLMVVGLMAKAH